MLPESKKEEFVAAFPESHYAAKASNPSTVSNILLPLDGTELSTAAIPVARSLAELYGATPHLVYCGETVIEPEAKLAKLGVQWQAIPGAVVDQSPGPPAEAVTSLANSLPGALIVMCTHTGHHHNSDRFGSVTEAILAENPARIVLVLPKTGSAIFKISRVLLAHDGTPTADCAVAPAAELAVRACADVIAVHVAAPRADHPQQTGCLLAPQYVDQPQHEWPSWAAEFSERMVAVGAPSSALTFELFVKGGQPGSEIALLARRRNVDIIVMGNPGKWRSSQHNMTRNVIRKSGCPVLLASADPVAPKFYSRERR